MVVKFLKIVKNVMHDFKDTQEKYKQKVDYVKVLLPFRNNK